MIPLNAKKVFSGVIFDVYQWPQELFDGTMQTFEMLKRRGSTDIVTVHNGKILLQQQEQPGRPPFLSFPGGQIEDGEDPLDGAKRELLEETGYVAQEWLLKSEVRPLSKIDWPMYVFVARECQQIQAQQLDPGEKISLMWVTLDELIEFVETKQMRQIEQDFRVELVRAKYHPPARAVLEKQLFGE